MTDFTITVPCCTGVADGPGPGVADGPGPGVADGPGTGVEVACGGVVGTTPALQVF